MENKLLEYLNPIMPLLLDVNFNRTQKEKYLSKAMQDYAEAYALAKTKELQAWKESAKSILDAVNLQECSKEMNLNPGSDIASAILPALKERFTEEQVREAIVLAHEMVDSDDMIFSQPRFSQDEIINQIKQK